MTRQDPLRRLEELKKQFEEMRTEDAFRSVQQMQARLRIETPWICTNYVFPHNLVDANEELYKELNISRKEARLRVCIHCLGVRRSHKMFRFIDRWDLPPFIDRWDLPPFPNVRDVTT